MRHRLALVGLWLLTTVLATVLATQTVRLVTNEVMYRANFGTPSAKARSSALGGPTHRRQLPGAPGAVAATTGVTTPPVPPTSPAPSSTNPTQDLTPADSTAGPSRAVRVPVSQAPTHSQTPTATVPAPSLPTRVPIASFPRDTVLTSPTTVALTAPPSVPSTTAPITTTTTTGPPVRVLSLKGGSISVRCTTSNTIRFVAASPAAGYNEADLNRGPVHVVVAFWREDQRLTYTIDCSGGLPHLVL